jgi:type II secretory ATPase GspE/PulE/Tfp pilus assembly ATPase PilB-like protein
MSAPTTDTKEQVVQGGRVGPHVMASFFDHLVKNQIITAAQAAQAALWKDQNVAEKRTMIEMIEQEFGIHRDVVRQQIAQYYAFRIIDPRDRSVRRLLPSEINKILRALPEQVMQQLLKAQLLPYDHAENQPDKIVLVTPNPSDREIHKLARALPYKKFEICYLKESDWTEYWRVLTSEREKPAPEKVVSPPAESTETEFENVMDREIGRTQLNSLLENIFADALRNRATEIHFMPLGPRRTDVLFRLDGHLCLWVSMEDVRCEAVPTALKMLSNNMDRYERMAAQQGMIFKLVEKMPLRMSVSSIPITSGDPGLRSESVVLHLIRETESVPSLRNIGLDAYSAEVLSAALTGRRGVILFTGFDHYALRTAIAASLKSIVKPALNIMTIEERVSYLVDGVRQIKLNPRLTASDAVRAIESHDPDVIVLGEIDGPETAAVALRLANIGQLVFCSIHARDAVTSLARLLRIVGNGLVLGDAVSAVVAQQTVRTLCSRCKQQLQPASLPLTIAHLRLREGESVPSKVHRAVGCIDCHGGYLGQEMLYEAFPITPGIRDILAGSNGCLNSDAVMKSAILDGMIPIRDKALDLVDKGQTTVEQLLHFAV